MIQRTAIPGAIVHCFKKITCVVLNTLRSLLADSEPTKSIFSLNTAQHRSSIGQVMANMPTSLSFIHQHLYGRP